MGAHRCLAIDPATADRRLGWSIFFDGELLRCGIGVDWIGITVDLCIIEKPQVYVRSKSKGDPNDLINLAFVAGMCAALVHSTELLTPVPHDWKGSREKKMHNRTILKSLTSAERAMVPDNHNVIDAIGLGLWALTQRGLRK